MEANEAADAAAELEATTAPAAEVPVIEATAPDAADGEQASVETQAALAADALPPVLTRDTAPACAPQGTYTAQDSLRKRVCAPQAVPAQDSLSAVLHAALAARDASESAALHAELVARDASALNAALAARDAGRDAALFAELAARDAVKEPAGAASSE